MTAIDEPLGSVSLNNLKLRKEYALAKTGSPAWVEGERLTVAADPQTVVG